MLLLLTYTGLPVRAVVVLQTTMQKNPEQASKIFSAGALGPDGGGDLETTPQTTKQKNPEQASKIFSAGALRSDGGRDLETPGTGGP